MKRRNAVIGAAFGAVFGLALVAVVGPTLLADERGPKDDVDRSVAAPLLLGSVDTVFVPIAPVRAFDSRVAVFPQSGILPRLHSRVISIKDGHNNAGVVIAADAVPPGATAISYNLTVTGATGPNFLAVTPGDAAGFTASAINFGGQFDVANAGIVSIDSTRSVRVWNGDQAGATHFIIDLTGYFVERDMWAKIDADPDGATVLNGHGVTSATRIANGQFSVTFDRAVSGCGWVATRNDNLDGVSSSGEIAIELGSAVDPTTLWVRTFDSAGTLADPSNSDGFTVYVDC